MWEQMRITVAGMRPIEPPPWLAPTYRIARHRQLVLTGPLPLNAVKTALNLLACGSKAGFGLNARFSAAKCLTDGPHRANVFGDEQTSRGRPLKGS